MLHSCHTSRNVSFDVSITLMPMLQRLFLFYARDLFSTSVHSSFIDIKQQ